MCAWFSQPVNDPMPALPFRFFTQFLCHLTSALSAQIGNVLKLEESQGPAFAECSAVQNQKFH